VDSRIDLDLRKNRVDLFKVRRRPDKFGVDGRCGEV
jgi:hypothetical protein